jgi:GDP-mannose 6-dehydrogenase
VVKYCDNLFHALKVTFANELGAIAHSAEVDARKIAEVFCADTKLNISTSYLRPGFAFGGSCLPKDLRAVLQFASSRSLQVPMLQGILKSNDAQIENLVRRILKHQPQAVGMVGLAFKPTSDDMRESPYVTVAKALVDEGVALRIYDPNVDPHRLVGRNRENVQKALGDLRKLLVSSLDEFSAADLVVIGHAAAIDSSIVHKWLKTGIRVLDLIGIEDIDRRTVCYEGIYW